MTIIHLGPVADLNELIPPKGTQTDAFDNSHALGQADWRDHYSSLLDVIDPRDAQGKRVLDPDVPSNVSHGPNTKAGALITGKAYHARHPDAYNLLHFDATAKPGESDWSAPTG